MKDRLIAALTALLDILELFLIPFPFNLAAIVVTTIIGMITIYRKQNARIAAAAKQAKESKLTKGWDAP